jgi:hypothetical protein
MAITLPQWLGVRDWATLEVLTSANMDDYVSRNLLYLYTFQGCRVYNNANVSIANNTNTFLTFNSEYYDPISAFTPSEYHSTSSNTGRITIPTIADPMTAAGYYLIFGHVQFAANTTGVRALSIRKNGSTYLVANSNNAASSFAHDIMIMTVDFLAEGDYVELQCYQNSGGALNSVFSSQYSPIFGVALLRQ